MVENGAMTLFSKIYLQPKSTEWVVFVHGAGGSSSIWFKQKRAFQEHFNLLMLDLRGHGKSKACEPALNKYRFKDITEDILRLLKSKKIESAHFVGVSLGSMLVKLLANDHPQRVKSMVLAGSIVSLNLKARTLLTVGNLFKGQVPFMWLYKIFATIILPRKNHSSSRALFIREAKRMEQSEFLKWFAMTKELKNALRQIRKELPSIPMLYIQGEEDHMFLRELRKMLEGRHKLLEVIRSCGHVVNVESAPRFNQLAISFIQRNL